MLVVCALGGVAACGCLGIEMGEICVLTLPWGIFMSIIKVWIPAVGLFYIG